MQPLNPLAVVDVALGATVDLGYGPSIDQKDLEAAPLEELIEGDPIRAYAPISAVANTLRR
jgi:hypothetical protein